MRSTGLCNGFVPNRQQAITLSNIYTQIYDGLT